MSDFPVEISCLGRVICRVSVGISFSLLVIVAGLWMQMAPSGAQGPDPSFAPVANPSPGEVVDVLTSISCQSWNFCMAVGMVGPPLLYYNYAERWNGTSWVVSDVTNNQLTNGQLNGVSCPTTRWCMAVGEHYTDLEVEPAAYTWSASGWTAIAPASPNSATNTISSLDAVSCLSQDFCIAVGYGGQSTTSSGRGSDIGYLLMEKWNGQTWTDISGSTTAVGNLTSVSCVSPDYCMAGGFDSTRSALAELWNGLTWSAQTVPGAAPGVAIDAISCVSETFCAAGTSGSELLVWNGSSWQNVPGISGVVYSGISCVTDDFCVLVGTGGIEEFHGGSGVALTELGDSMNGLNAWWGVSCGTATSCSVVGTTLSFVGTTLYSAGVESASTFIESWIAPFVRPAVGISRMGSGGYILGDSGGGVFSFGDAGYYGSMAGTTLNSSVVGISTTPDGKGYWEVASDGVVFTFGDANYFGSVAGTTLNLPIVGIAATPNGNGYLEVASDGGVFAFGDANYFGSMSGTTLNAPIVGISTTPDGKGYLEVASDGGVFAFGDANYFGSMSGTTLNAPIVGISMTTDGNGYLEVASDGGVFAFGDARYYGSKS